MSRGGDKLLERIEALCREKRISILELERMAGLKQRTVYKWDSSVPAIDKVKAVADVLGVTLDELMKDNE